MCSISMRRKGRIMAVKKHADGWITFFQMAGFSLLYAGLYQLWTMAFGAPPPTLPAVAFWVLGMTDILRSERKRSLEK